MVYSRVFKLYNNYLFHIKIKFKYEKNYYFIFCVQFNYLLFIFYSRCKQCNSEDFFKKFSIIFFIFGHFIKEKKININLNNKNWIIFIVLFILNSILGFYIKNQYIVGLFFYLSNIFSVIFILKICEKYSNFKVNSINFTGSHSLYFYLWHILPIIVLKSRVLNKNICLYYILGVISFYGIYIILKKIFLKKGGLKNV